VEKSPYSVEYKPHFPNNIKIIENLKSIKSKREAKPASLSPNRFFFENFRIAYRVSFLCIFTNALIRNKIFSQFH
jgi:hypothetical protein